MYDIDKLEKEWSVYNKKRKRPFYISLIFFALFVISISFVYFNESLNNKVKEMFNTMPKIQISSETNNVPSSESNISIVKEQEKLEKLEKTVSPVMITKTAPEIIVSEEPKPYDRASNEPVLEDVESLNNTNKANIFSQEEEASSKKMHLDILETSSVTAYKDVEQRFYQTHDTDDSLFLARSYFNRGEYKKAEYWALQTNKIDDTLEESWLLFAESKAKLGQRQDAIKVLQSYIRRSNSLQAKRLLEQIK
ncbi:CDC27 family protein [Sulfurovum sp. zt1-1]|uniref:CDC27 family protein n=1 Tax=Sulfurovum zhangzhouensis TaxID=3019067 RepID=A0ABT7QW10_9BACT|nr:CDC27 family protein [Sulfurovum zhangzhouensis]MDM5271016.1 CDC27 family protein [Sulfurovum zhangzhouensis]